MPPYVMAEATKKKRISTLAKSYEVTSELLLRLLKNEGIEVKSAASMIDAESFAKVKQTLLIEKEKKERREMAKAGMKIPMKAVIKKAAPPKKAKTADTEKKVTVKKTEAPEKEKISEPEAQPATPVAQPEEPVAEEKPQALEEAKAVEAPAPEKPAEPEAPALKVQVEKPDEKMAARIQKYLEESGPRPGQSKTVKGYSGRFGKVPAQSLVRKKTTGGPSDRPKDVYAMRAQEAGVFTGFTPGESKPDFRRDAPPDKKKGRSTRGKRRKSKQEIEQELLEMKSNVSKVMATLGRGSGKVKYRRDKAEAEGPEEKKVLEVAEFVTISELAGLMNANPTQIIAKCMELGMMVTINQRLDHETIAILADEFGFEVKLMDEYKEEVEDISTVEEKGEKVLRAPIVTIMGHVDHGKTSILDYIRKSRITAKESGGITQHIGAYTVETEHGPICFLDTPGHQAFAAMRSRGAQVTDIVVLVVAADSRVMPQTKEAIQHAKNANVQLVVAINKSDLPEANLDKIKTQLSEEGVQVEDWGGKTSCVAVSAKTGDGIDKLLEVLALESEVLELKANPDSRARGAVIETRLDKGKGPVATLLVQNGTLKVGDVFVCGSYSGRVRSLLDDRGQQLEKAGPSTPVQVLGLEGLPQAGDSFSSMKDEREAREVAVRRREAAKDRELRKKRHITLDQLHEQIQSGEFHELKIIVKGDVDGSVEAINSSLERLSTKEVKVNIISSGVGAVKDADVHLAAASNALIVAFHVLPTEAVRQLAEEEGVTINHYRVIYEVVDEVRLAMEGLLDPEYVEEITGEAKILELFKIPKVGIIAGCVVNSGSVDRDAKLRVYRDGIEISDARVSSLKRVKDDVKSVKAGLECGIGLEGTKDIQVGDVLAFFKQKQVAKKLSMAEA